MSSGLRTSTDLPVSPASPTNSATSPARSIPKGNASKKLLDEIENSRDEKGEPQPFIITHGEVERHAQNGWQSLHHFKSVAASVLEPAQREIKHLGRCKASENILETQVKPLASYLTNELLTKVMPNVISECHTDPRFSYFSLVKESDQPQKQMSIEGIEPEASDKDLEDYVRWLAIKAKKGEAADQEFSDLLHRLADAINEEQTVQLACERLGLSEVDTNSISAQFTDKLHSGKVKSSKRVIDIVGPATKTYKRMIDKARQAKKWEPTPGTAEQAITDPLRAKIESDDPFCLALACRLLEHLANVTRLKNRMMDPKPLQPININTNVRLSTNLLVEVQFVLPQVADLQEALHATYELHRAESALEAAEVVIGRPPVVLTIGQTGAGKSMICGAMSGIGRLFEAAPTTKSVTMWTRSASVQWRGRHTESGVIIVDTPGLADVEGDLKHLYDMVDNLKRIGFIDSILLVMNSEQCRLTRPMLAQLETFEKVFGGTFWNNVVFAFTRWYMDVESQKRRHGTAEDWQQKWTRALRQEFPSLHTMLGDRVMPAIFIDSRVLLFPDEVHQDEVAYAEGQIQQLKQMTLMQKPFNSTLVSPEALSRQFEEDLDRATCNYSDALFAAIDKSEDLEVIHASLGKKIAIAKEKWLKEVKQEDPATMTTQFAVSRWIVNTHRIRKLKMDIRSLAYLREAALSKVGKEDDLDVLLECAKHICKNGGFILALGKEVAALAKVPNEVLEQTKSEEQMLRRSASDQEKEVNKLEQLMRNSSEGVRSWEKMQEDMKMNLVQVKKTGFEKANSAWEARNQAGLDAAMAPKVREAMDAVSKLEADPSYQATLKAVERLHAARASMDKAFGASSNNKNWGLDMNPEVDIVQSRAEKQKSKNKAIAEWKAAEQALSEAQSKSKSVVEHLPSAWETVVAAMVEIANVDQQTLKESEEEALKKSNEEKATEGMDDVVPAMEPKMQAYLDAAARLEALELGIMQAAMQLEAAGLELQRAKEDHQAVVQAYIDEKNKKEETDQALKDLNDKMQRLRAQAAEVLATSEEATEISTSARRVVRIGVQAAEGKASEMQVDQVIHAYAFLAMQLGFGTHDLSILHTKAIAKVRAERNPHFLWECKRILSEEVQSEANAAKELQEVVVDSWVKAIELEMEKLQVDHAISKYFATIVQIGGGGSRLSKLHEILHSKVKDARDPDLLSECIKVIDKECETRDRSIVFTHVDPSDIEELRTIAMSSWLTGVESTVESLLTELADAKPDAATLLQSILKMATMCSQSASVLRGDDAAERWNGIHKAKILPCSFLSRCEGVEIPHLLIKIQGRATKSNADFLQAVVVGMHERHAQIQRFMAAMLEVLKTQDATAFFDKVLDGIDLGLDLGGADYISAGFTATALKAAGLTMAALKKAGFTLGELKTLGFSEEDDMSLYFF